MNSKIESGIELQKEMLIFFIGEKLPMTVKAVNDSFAIATRPIHRWHDAGLIKYQVEMHAFFTFTEAYKAMKDDVVYTIIDFKNNIRGPHDFVFNIYDFENEKDIKTLLKDLVSGDAKISHRHRGNYKLDFERTLNQNN